MNAQEIESNGIRISGYTHFEYKTKHASHAVKKEVHQKDVFEFHEDLNVGKYDAAGKMEHQSTNRSHIILAIQKQIDEQVKELTLYYKSIFEKSEETQKAKESLKNYFDENPEALHDIENGKVPEYWNKENTAKRIFDIALKGFKENDDKEEFFNKTKSMIEQAYSEVEEMFGGLPDLVLETRDAVLKGLVDFKNGKDISEITFS
ncbi:MAG: hypothetical protein JXQ65_02840 [Candidatus Marinimicrobia bacterium]|nr:hypothetical protein [Candidatus Neomarinimicrobiota bacterium]